jgi:hypothetical protein
VSEGTTTDISILGLALVSTTDIPAGTQVHFTIPPDITGRATVVRTQPDTDPNSVSSYCIALRFDDIPPQTQTYLERWLEK